MRERVETMVAGFEAGRLSREEFIDQLSALVGDRVARGPDSSTFRSLGLNHVALAVSDVAGMADFMSEHLGTTRIRIGPDRGFVAAGANHFVGLFRRDQTGLDHVCFSVEGYEPDDAAARVAEAGMEPHRAEDRVFFRGPDGILFQVADTWGDYPGGS
ncbi:MAG: VOC family protein [Acidimicrobiia bacterium]